MLTGPESLTLDESRRLGAPTGRAVTYHPETVEEAYASRPRRSTALAVDAWVSTYTAIANGEVAAVTDDVPH